MVRTVKVGSMELKVTKMVYADGTQGLSIDTPKVAVVIRQDGTVHVMYSKTTIAYDSNDEQVEIPRL